MVQYGDIKSIIHDLGNKGTKRWPEPMSIYHEMCSIAFNFVKKDKFVDLICNMCLEITFLNYHHILQLIDLMDTFIVLSHAFYNIYLGKKDSWMISPKWNFVFTMYYYDIIDVGISRYALACNRIISIATSILVTLVQIYYEDLKIPYHFSLFCYSVTWVTKNK